MIKLHNLLKHAITTKNKTFVGHLYKLTRANGLSEEVVQVCERSYSCDVTLLDGLH